eukprot:7868804-Lingulodinium_polyedra.AAC.1
MWGAKAAPRPDMPGLLHGNAKGHWLGARGRHATLAEHSRALGLGSHGVQWPAEEAIGFALLGNTMAKCVLQRLIHVVLVHWG